MSGFQQERDALGIHLRELRRAAGLNGKELAALLGWPPSKVSKIEHGRQTPTEADLAAWAQAVGAPHAVEALTARLRALETHYVTWRRQLRAGTRPRQQASLDLEARSGIIRAMETAVVPGLLQTPEYAHHVLQAWVTLHRTPDDVPEGVRVRMQRQLVLYDLSKRFHFLICETVLRARVCPAAVLRGQIDRLIALTTLNNVALGIIPFGVELPFPVLHGFWVFDERVVLVETLGAEITVTDEDEIQLYLQAFDQAAGLAVYGERARALLSDTLVDLTD
ncbi:hypothetical protein TH66_00805 [Carbonactinospora thermoautotrophica]|uniref:HTH cro/C1-type domain-containing protein n=1 Tax=Carbonactinospora thermoautotrophica TaxID=1469144 RepID=A0A132N7A5_9ACTN|nr:helix-turn-helix transcriptional regulator [Carbonactinospora thermoautotrophica]KWX05896.1 hypothetical protein TH66_00805 [Carbonactinospora thermoautotrophica]KWX09215.1 hypothetical protein TR74_10955 [Carbonactinospora thermoautotrophica]